MQARARDLFYGLWATDVFMQRVEANADWSLFCPNEAPGLADCWGEEHAALYARYECEGRAKRTVKAQQLWFAILEAQVSCHCDRKCLKLPLHCVCAYTQSHCAGAGGDWQPIHAFQGLMQSQVKPTKSGDNQVQQSVHRDHRIYITG